jgi:SAM-dependent methyltransferase
MKLKYHLVILLLILFIVPVKSFCQKVVIDTAAREKERLRWNKALVKDSTYLFKKEVNSFLAEAIKGRKPGKAVDVGMGQGRNAIYMAKMGWKVTGFDIADEAIKYAKAQTKLQHVHIKTVLKGSEEFDFGKEKWDLISFIYEGCLEDVPGLLERMKTGLKKGGILVFEFFHREAGIEMKRNDFGCPADAEKDFVRKSGGLKILNYEEKYGTADFGLIDCKLIYLIVEKE